MNVTNIALSPHFTFCCFKGHFLCAYKFRFIFSAMNQNFMNGVGCVQCTMPNEGPFCLWLMYLFITMGYKSFQRLRHSRHFLCWEKLVNFDFDYDNFVGINVPYALFLYVDDVCHSWNYVVSTHFWRWRVLWMGIYWTSVNEYSVIWVSRIHSHLHLSWLPCYYLWCPQILTCLLVYGVALDCA